MKVKMRLLVALGVVLLAGVVAFNFMSRPELEDSLNMVPGGVVIGEFPDEGVPLGDLPELDAFLDAVASGVNVKSVAKCKIDYSNTKDGYFMVKWLGASSSNVKVQSTGKSGVTYTYNLKADGTFEVFPLSDGDGSYKIAVYENIQDNKYAQVVSLSLTAKMDDEFAPFIRPNQYVNYKKDSNAVKVAVEQCEGITDNLEKVAKIYNYVVSNLTYDRAKAKTVKSGYLPDLDSVLASKKGICFDYAALMTGMLRSQGVPCKLVVGYAGKAYHAWINVWSEEQGWVDSMIYFDGKDWKLMDPTFASTGNQSETIMKYIGDGKNYQAKYMY